MTERAQKILREARETLDTARMGLDLLRGDDPTKRRPGIRNVATFGQATTGVLQKLRGIDKERFNAWYEPRQEAMRRDPLLRYFWNLRNEILKEGTPPSMGSMHIESLHGSELAPLMRNPPPGARGFFMGDRLGGSGWEVELPDGTVQTFYVALPEGMKVTTAMHFPNPPTEHLGQPIADTSLANLSDLYLGYLSSLLDEADDEFTDAERFEA